MDMLGYRDFVAIQQYFMSHVSKCLWSGVKVIIDSKSTSIAQEASMCSRLNPIPIKRRSASQALRPTLLPALSIVDSDSLKASHLRVVFWYHLPSLQDHTYTRYGLESCDTASEISQASYIKARPNPCLSMCCYILVLASTVVTSGNGS